MSDLIERLKEWEPLVRDAEGCAVREEMREAATALAEKNVRIAELEAERDRFAVTVVNLADQRDASRAECEELRAALEEIASQADNHKQSRATYENGDNIALVNIANIARAALIQKETGDAA